MIASTSAQGADEVRYPVLAGRVTCVRLGAVEVERCRECVYLLRMESSAGTPTHVVCAAQDLEPEFDFAW
jgi:hypothetical protein